MSNNTIPTPSPELAQVYKEMKEIGEKIEQAQQEVENFTNEVKLLNEHFAELHKQWEEMSARHREIYKPRDISAILERAGIEPDSNASERTIEHE